MKDIPLIFLIIYINQTYSWSSKSLPILFFWFGGLRILVIWYVTLNLSGGICWYLILVNMLITYLKMLRDKLLYSVQTNGELYILIAF